MCRPLPGWEVRTSPCYGGWYWDLFFHNVKVNGGLEEFRWMARAAGCTEARRRAGRHQEPGRS